MIFSNLILLNQIQRALMAKTDRVLGSREKLLDIFKADAFQTSLQKRERYVFNLFQCNYDNDDDYEEMQQE